MNRELLWMWNETVTNKDTVYFLGDFFMKANRAEMKEILRKLNGKDIFIVKGNHDQDLLRMLYAGDGTWTNSLRKPIWISKEFPKIKVIDPVCTVKIQDHRFVLCHYPIKSWDSMYHGTIHLHGHCHGKTALEVVGTSSRPNYRIDVGYDANKRMLSYEDIISMVRKTKKVDYDFK